MQTTTIPKNTIKRKKAIALLKHLGREALEFETSSYDDCLFENGDQEYLVLTDDEANDRWEESLDNYLEECVYPELPENMVNYFDDDKWKHDARFDGRGHSLSHYDGAEHEYNIDGEWIFIYRIN